MCLLIKGCLLRQLFRVYIHTYICTWSTRYRLFCHSVSTQVFLVRTWNSPFLLIFCKEKDIFCLTECNFYHWKDCWGRSERERETERQREFISMILLFCNFAKLQLYKGSGWRIVCAVKLVASLIVQCWSLALQLSNISPFFILHHLKPRLI